MSQVGKNIKKIRNVKSLSQQAFADLFELTRGNISSYEEFRAEPKIETIARIAKYFSIPLSDFIEKELSVNELLHYNTKIAENPAKLKITQQLIQVPYVPGLYQNDYLMQYNDPDYIAKLPQITVPTNSVFKLIAFELNNPDILPNGFDYHTGDILIFEQITKENAHRITGKLGIQVSQQEIKSGIYANKDGDTILSLNEWVHYPFDIDSESEYWMLKAAYVQK